MIFLIIIGGKYFQAFFLGIFENSNDFWRDLIYPAAEISPNFGGESGLVRGHHLRDVFMDRSSHDVLDRGPLF